MSKSILNHFGRSHSDYIHAKGRLATSEIIALLDPRPLEDILEVGFGTGATLVHLASEYSDVNFFGYELAPVMFNKASQRIRFCGLSDCVQLTLLEQKNKFPCSKDAFDKIYLESVIGIQEKEDFINMLQEIKRALKPNGLLIFNETMWLESTSLREILEINEFCKHSFGIIQASSDYPYLRDYKDVLFEVGLHFERAIAVSEIERNTEGIFRSKSVFLSKIFTVWGKVKVRLAPSMKAEQKNYKRDISLLMGNRRKIMEGIIVTASNSIKRL